MKKRNWLEIGLLGVLALVLILALVLNGWKTDEAAVEYASLFETDRVHTLDIRLSAEEWAAFLETCTDKQYIACDVVIDGETVKNVGLRAKGNSSMQRVTQAGNGRYSLKIEFDQYVDGQLYKGLDKLALNNLVNDDSGMKDFMAYRLMDEFGVAAPLCSYIWITVNGEDWGLFLAVEAIEDSFLQRNFGLDHGELYKPDSFDDDDGDADDDREEETSGGASGGMAMPGMMRASGEAAETEETTETTAADASAEPAETEETASGEVSEETETSSRTASSREMRMPGGGGGMPGGMGGGLSGMGSEDLLLRYIDDDPASYPNIFGAEKTNVTKADRQRLIASLKQLSAGEDIPSVVDVDQVIRYFVVHGFVCNGDSYTGSMHHNYYLYEKNGRLSMIPWDYNEAYGGFGGGNDMDSTINEPMDDPVSSGTVEERPILAWIFADEEYQNEYHALYEVFLRQYIESGRAEEMIRETAELIAPYMEKDPTAFCSYEEFLTDVEWMSTYFALRGASLWAQLEGAIPSTAEGQAADSSAFIDASALGSSSGEMGGGMRSRSGASGEASPEAEETGEVVPDPNPPV